MKNRLKSLLGIFIFIAIISGLICGAAALVMLFWNYSVVSSFPVALPITYLKALAGSGIAGGIIVVFSTLKGYIEYRNKNAELKAAIEMMKKVGQEEGGISVSDDDGTLMNHFK